MLPRVLAIAIIAIAIAAVASTSYLYLAPSLLDNSSNKPAVTVISIPKGSAIHPLGFNLTQLLTNTYHFPFNFTVVIGVNNTIEWINNDVVEHTVTAFIGPAGSSMFNSGLILPGKSFSATLTVPGIYKYTCAWHQWLAGQISVKLP
jgi:hypothetical protein